MKDLYTPYVRPDGKNNLLVSFSGGETSAFMAQWLWNHKQDEYNMVFVFSNTGLENEETLEFVEKCSKHFGFHVQWIEAMPYLNERKSTGYWGVDFETANRVGRPFEKVINKYGIPNMMSPHCTRELKQNPIKAFGFDWFEGQDYYTAIGVRADEADRINKDAKAKRFIYPLISSGLMPATKPMINFYWKNMPFRLNLKGYQGNCQTCWKKSDKKLFQIAKENPKAFDFMDQMEKDHPYIYKDNKQIGPLTFFRNNRSAKDIIELSKQFDETIIDDSQSTAIQYSLDLIGGDSCEVFSECSNEG